MDNAPFCSSSVYLLFLGFTDFTLPTPLMNITGNLFNPQALQNHSGCGYGEHHHVNINRTEDIPTELGALLGVYLIFRFLFCFATKILINTELKYCVIVMHIINRGGYFKECIGVPPQFQFEEPPKDSPGTFSF